MSEKEHPLGEEAEEELGQAFLDYREKLKLIYDKFSDEKLLDFAEPLTLEVSSASSSRVPFQRYVAYNEVSMRRMSRRADEVMKRTGGSAYCVFHDCDVRECAHLHNDGD